MFSKHEDKNENPKYKIEKGVLEKRKEEVENV